MLMDSIFGPTNFRSEIIWKRTAAHSFSKRWGDIHDSILFYTSGSTWTWNEVLIEHTEEYSARYKSRDEKGIPWSDDNLTAPGVRHGDSGSVWRGFDVTAKGSHWKVNSKTVDLIVGPEVAKTMSTTQKLDLLDESGFIHWPRGGAGFPRFKRYLSAGSHIQDMITDIPPINSQAQERLGYPTQKPEALLERIIKASSNEGDVVVDPFCGCGTAVVAAQSLNRKWIGIDVTHLAIGLIKQRLHDKFGEAIKSAYQVFGEPTDLAGARRLAEDDKFQFEAWALSTVGARPSGQIKRGADKGIDGRLFFHDDSSGKSKQIILSVKGGHTEHSHMRDLRGVLDREEAQIGVLITLEPASKPMLKEVASAGFYTSPAFANSAFPRLQILTIEEILEGKGIDFPRMHQTTFKQAPRAKSKSPENLTLDLT